MLLHWSLLVSVLVLFQWDVVISTKRIFKISTQNGGVDEILSELRNLKSYVKSCCGANSDSSDSNESKEQPLRDLVNECKNELNVTLLQVEKFKLQATSSTKRVAVLEEQVKSLESCSGKLQTALTTVTEMTKQVKVFETSSKEQVIQLKNLQESVTSLTTQLQTSQVALNGCTNQLQGERGTSGALQGRVNTLEAELQNLRNQLNNAQNAGCVGGARGGGRCAGRPVRWSERRGFHEVSTDVDVKRNLNPDQCRQACFNNHRCESADYENGNCYLNAGRTALVHNPALTLFMFECC